MKGDHARQPFPSLETWALSIHSDDYEMLDLHYSSGTWPIVSGPFISFDVTKPTLCNLLRYIYEIQRHSLEVVGLHP